MENDEEESKRVCTAEEIQRTKEVKKHYSAMVKAAFYDILPQADRLVEQRPEDETGMWEKKTYRIYLPLGVYWPEPVTRRLEARLARHFKQYNGTWRYTADEHSLEFIKD